MPSAVLASASPMLVARAPLSAPGLFAFSQPVSSTVPAFGALKRQFAQPYLEATADAREHGTIIEICAVGVHPGKLEWWLIRCEEPQDKKFVIVGGRKR